MVQKESENEVKLRSGLGRIILYIVIFYFIYRAISVWLPNIYSAIEIFTYNKINHIWYLILIAAVVTSLIHCLSKNFDSSFASFTGKTFYFVSIILSMILSTWLIFNVAGIGNLHYITNLIANSETIAPDKINEESNGEWVLKVQDFILEKRLEKKNPVDSEKKGIFKVVSDFIKSEYDAAPEFIQIILQILGFIIAVICVIVFILLWLFIDLSPLILVPITGVLLLVPIYFLSSSVLVIFVKNCKFSFCNKKQSQPHRNIFS